MRGHRDILTPFRKSDGCLLFAVEAEIFTLLWLGSRLKVFSDAFNQSRMYHRKYPEGRNEGRNIGCPVRNSIRQSLLVSNVQCFSCTSLSQQQLVCVSSPVLMAHVPSCKTGREGEKNS